ncbi:MAG: acetate kinase [Clostridiales bacterium]|nr:MAG: acetate kinase [Clostridiales bacterium]
MKILVINCGSSSLKYQLIDMNTESQLANGLVERIGIDGSRIKHEKVGMDKVVIESPMKDHKIALNFVLDALKDEKHGVIKDINEIEAVGHRVVHAGEKYSESVLINDEVLKALKDCIELAPLHNPANIMGIEAMQELLPNAPMVAVFDTAFHQTMPEKEFIYAIDYKYYKNYSVRRYGMHGTSHRYVSSRAAEILGKDLKDIKMITCHLGNGSSIAALNNGKVVATSMGFTPLEGLAMGTRCGDIDPAVITYLMKKENLDAEQMDKVMNKESGVLGISGVSSDFRDIEEAAKDGNHRAELALDIFNERVRKYIGSYSAILGGVDVIVFTAGVGENSISNREEIMKNFEYLGVDFDSNLNNVRGKEAIITKPNSKVTVVVVPTNEELMIARDTKALSK